MVADRRKIGLVFPIRSPILCPTEDQQRSLHWHYAIANTIMKAIPFKVGKRKRITYRQFAKMYLR